MDRRRVVAHVRRLLSGGESVLLVAPAGLGKSTVADQVVSGMSCTRVQMRAGESDPLRPLEQALGPGLAGEAAEVAAQVAERLGDGVLLVEDLHWADPVVLDVLSVLTSLRPVLMTSRTPLAVPAEVVEVSPLSDKAADGLLRRLDGSLDVERRRAIVRAAAGSPLLLNTFAAADPSAPAELGALVARQLAAMTPSDQWWVKVVALAGRPTSRTVPRGARRLLVAQPDGRRWFVHDAVAEAVREQMSSQERDRAVETLLQLVGPLERPRLLRMRGWIQEAVKAAQEALPLATRVQRIALLRLACDGLGDHAPADLLADYATALLEGGVTAEARQAASLAQTRAVTASERARAALVSARAAHQGGDNRVAEHMCRTGYAEEDSDPETRALLAVELATILVRERPSDPEVDVWVATARDLAERTGVGRPAARNAAGLALSHRSQPGWEAEFLAAEELARAEGDEEQECAAAYWRASAYGFHGPYALVPPLVTRMLERTSSRGLRRWHHHFLVVRAAERFSSGWITDGDVAELEQALAADPVYRNRAQFEAALTMMRAERGELAAARDLVWLARARARHDEELSLVLAGAAELALAAGHVPGMLDVLQEFSQLSSRWFLAGALVESAAVDLWLHARAHGAVPPELPAVKWPHMSGMAPVRTARQALDLLDEQPERACQLLVSAADEFFAQGRPRWGRRARLGAAYAALVGGRPGRARELVAPLAALDMPGAQDLSVRRAVELTQRLAAEQWRHQLSPAQRRVMEGVASGLTSRQIAADLGVARSTVETHVRTVLERTGCSSRAQAVALLMGDVAARPRTPGVHGALVAELAGGRTLAQAAQTLGVSPRTAARRLAEAKRQAGVSTTAQLLAQRHVSPSESSVRNGDATASDA